jgi:hypothetical protein
MIRRQSSHTIRQSLVIPYGAIGIGKPQIISFVKDSVQSRQGYKVSVFYLSPERNLHFFDKKILTFQKGAKSGVFCGFPPTDGDTLFLRFGLNIKKGLKTK